MMSAFTAQGTTITSTATVTSVRHTATTTMSCVFGSLLNLVLPHVGWIVGIVSHEMHC